MKVLHVNTERGWSGGEAQTCYLIGGLEARGVSNVLVAQPGSEIAERMRGRGVQVVEVAMHGELDVPAILRLRGIMREIRPDIVQLHTSHAHGLGWLAARLAGVRPVVATRRMDHESNGYFERLKYHGVDHMVAISAAVRGVLLASGLGADRITLIHSSVDFPDPYPSGDLRAELGIAAEAPVIGTVAGLTERKGHAHVFAALRSIKDRHPGVRLLVAGEGPRESALRELAGELDLAREIIFLGFRDDIPQVLNTLDVFVLASLKEGLGVAVLEAAWRGLPIVASNAGGIPEIVQDGATGLLVPPADSDALADGLLFMLDHPAEARAMGEAAGALVRSKFSVETMVEGYFSLYRGLLAGRAS